MESLWPWRRRIALILLLPCFLGGCSSKRVSTAEADSPTRTNILQPAPEIHCAIDVIQRAQARFLIGENGELMKQTKEMVTHTDTIWMITIGKNAELIAIDDNGCYTIATVNEDADISWQMKGWNFENAPETLSIQDLNDGSITFLARNLHETQLAADDSMRKCFRTRSGDLHVLDVTTPNFEFFYYMYKTEDFLLLAKGGEKAKNSALIEVNIETSIARSNNKVLRDGFWATRDTNGRAAMPSPGMIIDIESGTSTVTIEPDGTETWEVPAIE